MEPSMCIKVWWNAEMSKTWCPSVTLFEDMQYHLKTKNLEFKWVGTPHFGETGLDHVTTCALKWFGIII